MESQQLLFEEPRQCARRRGTDRRQRHQEDLVEGLFGQFDYELPDASNPTDVSKVMILYGENGSGKTTVLRALFHLLSPANNRGHRNALSKIPFKLFKVIFEDGGWLSLSRELEIIGTYTIEGQIQDQSISIVFNAGVEKKFGTEEQEQSFITFIRMVSQTVYFLSADRAIMSDVLPRVDPDEEQLPSWDTMSSQEQGVIGYWSPAQNTFSETYLWRGRCNLRTIGFGGKQFEQRRWAQRIPTRSTPTL